MEVKVQTLAPFPALSTGSSLSRPAWAPVSTACVLRRIVSSLGLGYLTPCLSVPGSQTGHLKTTEMSSLTSLEPEDVWVAQPSGHGNLVWAQDPGTEQLGQLKRCLEVESVRPDHYRLRLGQEAEIWEEDWGRSLGCEWRTGQEAGAWPGVTLFPWQAREEGKLERSRSMVWSWE